MSFIAPYSPPDEHSTGQSALKMTRPGGAFARPGAGTAASDVFGGVMGPHRTADRKRNGLRKTRTESSLPTPPRTRDRRTSHSPDSSAQTSSTKRRATSSSRPFDLPSETVDGLIPSADIDFSSASSSRDASSSTNTFLPLSPPLTSSRTKKRHPAHRQVDSLGPTRRAALKGGFVSVDWKAPPPPAFIPDARTDQELPPLPVRKEKTKYNRDPSKGPIWEEGNPFLEGMGLRDKGLVSDEPRVGTLEEKETIGYVFRGTKTVFANPFYTGRAQPYAPHPSRAESLDISHPDFTPAANPPPRLLFPTKSASGTSSHAAGRYSQADDDDDDDDDEDSEVVRAVPSRLFSGAEGVQMDLDEDDQTEEADERGRGVSKRSLDAFGGGSQPTDKRRRLADHLRV